MSILQQPLQILATAFGMALFTACSTYSVKTDYNPTISYGRYKTFDWYAASKSAKGKGSGTDPLLDKRVRASVQATLESKGFRQETVAEPDFLVTYFPIYRTKKFLTATSYVGSDGWGRRIGDYGTGTISNSNQLHKFREGTIVLEVVDSKSNQLVWQGAAEGVVTSLDTSEDKQKKISKAVRDLLANFPPELRK